MSSSKVTIDSQDFQNNKHQQTIPKGIQGKIDLELTNDYDYQKRDETGKKNYQGALQFKPKQFDLEEDDLMINQWKDERLRKLQDFTKDLMSSTKAASSKESETLPQIYQYQGLKRDFESDLKSKPIVFQIQQKVLSPVMLKSPGLEYTSNHTAGSHQKPFRAPDIRVENEESESDIDEEELMLTKSEGTMVLQTQAISTQRSIHQQSGEFEKRITDIKAKLNQIKNTINNEIENSFQALNNSETLQESNQDREQNSNFKGQREEPKQSYRDPYPTQSYREHIQRDSYRATIQRSTYREEPKQQSYREEQRQRDTYRGCYEDRPRSLENSKQKGQHNSVLSSLDNFQNKLNAIKGNMTQQNAQYQIKMQEQFEKEKFARLKTIIDNSYNSTTSPSKNNSTVKTSTYHDEKTSQKDPVTLGDTFTYSNQKRPQSDYETLRENESLKQKLQVMASNEQRMQKKLQDIIDEQGQDKKRYEDQLTLMQNEMTKMCELISELTKQKSARQKSHRKNHNQNCSKKKRILELEDTVRDLQMQVNSKTTSTCQPTIVTQQEGETINIDIQTDTKKEINLPRKNSRTKNRDKEELKDQVTFLEKKLKTLKNDIKESRNAQTLGEQLQFEREENEHLRNTYNKTYSEMMNAFQQFKDEMEKKQSMIEEEQKVRTDMIEMRFREELSKKGQEIEKLEVENQNLKERMKKIREAFDMPRQQQSETERFSKNKENLEVKSGKKKSNSKGKMVKKKAKNPLQAPLQVRAVSQKKKINF